MVSSSSRILQGLVLNIVYYTYRAAAKIIIHWIIIWFSCFTFNYLIYYVSINRVTMLFSVGDKSDSLNVGAVVGGAVGGLIVVVLIVIVTALLFWKLSYVSTSMFVI